jgi:predicted Zn-dependent protease
MRFCLIKAVTIRKLFAAGLMFMTVMAVLFGAACGHSLSPSEALCASRKSFTEIETFQVRFQITAGGDCVGATTEGQAGYQGHTLVYSIVCPGGGTPEQDEISELLFISPDIYLRMSWGDWYVLSPWNQGINPDEMAEFPQTYEIIDYSLVTQQLSNIERLPDQVVDGLHYLRFAGTLDPCDSPAATPVTSSDSPYDDAETNVELWLDRETFLPYKILMETGPGGAESSLLTDTALEFFDYGRPITPPEPPNDFRPWRDLELAQAPCTGAELAQCLEAQAELQSISRSDCDGDGKRVCIVPLGQVQPDLIQHSVDHYRDRYGLTITVLTPSAVPSDMVNPLREQVDASTLIDYMGSLFPDAYRDPDVVLIGLTPIDLYDEDSHFRYVFGVKGTAAYPKAVISTFRMDPVTYGEPPNDELFCCSRAPASLFLSTLACCFTVSLPVPIREALCTTLSWA